MHGIEEVWNVLMIEMNKCIYVYIVLIELWTRSPNKEVENWKIRSVFKCFSRFFKFGKVRKTEEILADFLKKSKCLEKKKKKEKKNLHFASALFSKDVLRIVKGFAPWILFDCFEEKFLYPLECREVPSGS